MDSSMSGVTAPICKVLQMMLLLISCQNMLSPWGWGWGDGQGARNMIKDEPQKA